MTESERKLRCYALRLAHAAAAASVRRQSAQSTSGQSADPEQRTERAAQGGGQATAVGKPVHPLIRAGSDRRIGVVVRSAS
ncbi:hypothetical protein [Amycolatopsis sp. RTGN1]|uniref:hypothetical protein n=1 Tax=Amycolatopsis ponsaeliensis TaxID=2992142 RepID=UPI00254CBB40|nr:hypothetical protein [Amycolatopsis sp. RTGN1]